MPRCSKASRGLFVPPRVARIFTGHAVSPSPPLRQFSGRSAFHAGRNLPDKGFRYLRTVRVTAAVHRGFRSKLRLAASPLPLTFRHWAGVGPYISGFPLARTCVLVKQSPEMLRCDRTRLRGQAPSPGAARLLPKVRRSFAEFLSGGYLERLGVLTPAHQCRFAVRAPPVLPTRLFLEVPPDAVRAAVAALPRPPGRLSALTGADRPCPMGRPRLLDPVPGGSTNGRRCRNFDRLSFGIPLRVILRPRLTLRRLTYRRNPWAFSVPSLHRD